MSPPTVMALIGGLGTSEVLFILLIIMLLFGAAKIPDLARSLGKAQREFQHARDEIEREVEKPGKKTARPTAKAAGGGGQPSEKAPDDSDDARVLIEAHTLGIETAGKSMDAIRSEISENRGANPPKE